MLRRPNRLSTQQLSDLIAKGKIIHSSLFLMRVASLLPESKTFHFAAVAPQKIFKTAVSRNRMRRRTYEAVKQIINNIVGVHTVAVFAKAGAKDAKLSEVKQDLQSLFVKAGLLR